VQQVLTALKAEAAVEPYQLCNAQVLADLEMCFEIRRRTDARILSLLHEASGRDLVAEMCGRSPRSWLIEDQRLSGHEASRLVTLSRHLPVRTQLAHAVAGGEISLEQAAPILRTVKKLPFADQDVDEKILVEFARDHDVDMVRTLCHKTLEAACADEETEARRERVYGSRYLKLSETFDGMIKLDAMLTPEQGAAVEAVITSLAHKLGAEDDRTAPQRNADALATLAQAALGFDALLPEFNGEQPHVNAVMHYDPLCDALRPYADQPIADDGGFTINGTTVSPQTARMLACDAQIIPVVMRGESEVLDIGRASRSWPKAIRKALQLEDHGCGWPGCQMPLWACRIHHILWWRDGGETNKTNGVHLCNFHHWLVHNRPWKIWRDNTGRIEVARNQVSRT
jgi:hypothetical protein